MSERRERNQVFNKALLCSPCFNQNTDPLENRQAAINWGMQAYDINVKEPFTPSGSGALAAGFWPAETGALIELVDKGCLPSDADLEYGVTIRAARFHGIRRLDDGSFIAIISGTVIFANKVEQVDEPIAATEAKDG